MIATAIISTCFNEVDEELRETKREEGLRQVSKFTWEEAGRKTVEVFRRVV